MFCPAQNKLFAEKEAPWLWLHSQFFLTPSKIRYLTLPPAYESLPSITSFLHRETQLGHHCVTAGAERVIDFICPEKYSMSHLVLVLLLCRRLSDSIPIISTQKKCILQPWITNANSPVLRHYLLGSSYHLAVKDVIRYRYETITHSRDISLWL